VPSRTGPAAAVLHAHLHNEMAELKLRDPQVRQDKPDSVHKMRVATRRLRSTLATFRPLMDRERTDPLRQELKWLAGILGAARDAEVMRARLAVMIGEQPPDLLVGPVARRVDKELRAMYREAHARVVEALDSSRYFALLDGLDALDSAPPWTGSAEEPAGRILPIYVRRDWKRLRGQAEAIDATASAERDHRLHELRKSAKRVRYAAEAVESVFGQQAKAVAKAAKHMQEPLGHHQDSVVLRELLRELGMRAHLDGQNAFTYGRLHALEEARAHDTEQQAAVAWKNASHKRLRRWLRKPSSAQQ
jgi:CHAD domain-containing protein